MAESRQNKPAEMVLDPVCGMKVDPQQTEFSHDYQGQPYYFCSQSCLEKFKQNPDAYRVHPGAPL
jgi:YHS domain-containing protein